jgi:hypothetical protein
MVPNVVMVRVILSFELVPLSLPAEQPVASMAMTEAMAMPAPIVVRRERLTVTPLCAWIRE